MNEYLTYKKCGQIIHNYRKYLKIYTYYIYLKIVLFFSRFLKT